MTGAGLTDTRGVHDGLATIYLWVGVAVFVVVTVTVLVFLVRFRDRGDADPRRPSRRHGAPRLEWSTVALLAVVTAVLLGLSFHSQLRIDGITHAARAQAAPVRVQVIGAQWQWRFQYPGGAGTPRVEQTAPEGTPPRLVVPVGRRVLFSGRSLDVLHDFWIPDLRFQRQVWPDHTETWALVFPKAGRYPGVCAWFCGLYHQNMHFVAVAVPPGRFDAWLARRRAEAGS